MPNREQRHPSIPQRRPEWLDLESYPFERRSLEIEGNQIHYIDEGAGPPILFLHSNPLWSFMYRDVIRGLRGKFRCIAIDYPGFGLSVASPRFGYTLPELTRIVEQFVLALELCEATLMVHDAAGPIGLPVAVAHPERFRALIIADTFAWPLQAYPRVARMIDFVGGPVFRAINVQTNLLLRATLRFGARRRRFTSVERAAFLGPFADRAARPRIHTLFAELTAREAELSQLTTGLRLLQDRPVLLIYGEHDPIRAEGFQSRFEQIFPLHTSIVVAGAAHFAPLEAPEEIVAAIEAWWPGVELARLAA